VLLALMVLAGCRSMIDAVFGETEVETETSLVIKNAATGFVLAKENGIMPQMLQAEFERQFPGIEFDGIVRFDSFSTVREVDTRFQYEGKTYRIKHNNAEKTGKVIRIGSCVELQKKEKKETQ
jgi:hypothetical protein